jgi:hypothetical protein
LSKAEGRSLAPTPFRPSVGEGTGNELLAAHSVTAASSPLRRFRCGPDAAAGHELVEIRTEITDRPPESTEGRPSTINATLRQRARGTVEISRRFVRGQIVF